MKRAGPYFQGGPRRSSEAMARTCAALRDEGGLPPEGSLIFSQLLLNLAGHAGRAKAEKLIGAFLDAADVRDGDEVLRLGFLRFDDEEPS